MMVRLIALVWRINLRELGKKILHAAGLSVVILLPLLYLNVSLIKRGFSPQQMSAELRGEKSDDTIQLPPEASDE